MPLYKGGAIICVPAAELVIFAEQNPEMMAQVLEWDNYQYISLKLAREINPRGAEDLQALEDRLRAEIDRDEIPATVIRWPVH